MRDLTKSLHHPTILLLTATLLLPLHSIAAAGPTPIPLLDALEDGLILAKAIPHGAYRLQLKVRNQTDRPLQIEVTPGLVADSFAGLSVPGEPYGAQLLQAAGARAGGGGFQSVGLLESPTLTLRPNQTVTRVVRSACLNYDLPEPSSNDPMFLKAVEDYSPNPQLTNILREAARLGLKASEAQPMLWHATNQLSWDQLTRVSGVYSPSDVERSAAFFYRQVNSNPTEARTSTQGDRPAAENAEGEREAARPSPAWGAGSTWLIGMAPGAPAAVDGLVRILTKSLRQQGYEASHANFIRIPEHPSRPALAWQVQAESFGRTGRIRLNVQAWLWDPEPRVWRPGRIATTTVHLIDPASPNDPPRTPEAAWLLVEALRQPVAECALDAKWKPGKRKDGVVVLINRLPSPIDSVTLGDPAKPAAAITLQELALLPGESREISLSEEQSRKTRGLKLPRPLDLALSLPANAGH